MGLRKAFLVSRIFRYVLLLTGYSKVDCFENKVPCEDIRGIHSCRLKSLEAELVRQFLCGSGFPVVEWDIYSLMHPCMRACICQYSLCSRHMPDTVLVFGIHGNNTGKDPCPQKLTF